MIKKKTYKVLCFIGLFFLFVSTVFLCGFHKLLSRPRLLCQFSDFLVHSCTLRSIDRANFQARFSFWYFLRIIFRYVRLFSKNFLPRFLSRRLLIDVYSLNIISLNQDFLNNKLPTFRKSNLIFTKSYRLQKLRAFKPICAYRSFLKTPRAFCPRRHWLIYYNMV